MNLRSFASLTALALLVGCSSSGGNNGNNNTEADTSVDEDTGGGDDTGGGEDSSTADSSAPDTSTPVDSGSASETAVGDAGDAAADAYADAAEVSTKCGKAGDIESGDCGKCGTRARLCDSTGVWLPWGACTGEKGVCIAGETRMVSCGKCGKRSETCSTMCAWEPSACTGEGICNAGDVEVQYGACANPKYVKTRSCTATCGWGDWSGCVPPKGWNDMAPTSASGRYYHTAVWSGAEMIVWGGFNGSYLSDGQAYNVSTDAWRTIAPVTGAVTGFAARYNHTAVWTGSKMIVWGGYSPSYRSDGAAYDPSTNSWSSIASSPLVGRYGHTAVWTGTEMIVWGGYSPSYLSDGAAYNPATNTWRTLAAAPLSGRYSHTAVWTGEKMVVYGGYGTSCASSYCGDAAAYDPASNTWTSLTPPSSDLDGRYYATGVVAGTATKPLAVFWGGYGSLVASSYYRNNGGIFDASAGTWKSMAVPTETVLPGSKRYYQTAWSSGDAVFIWGGYSSTTTYSPSGAIYDLATDTWKAMSDTNVPAGRYLATAVWTGAEAIVWGGYSGTYRNDGKIYRP
jgi:N-acetylneuraminic acid mutarotase